VLFQAQPKNQEVTVEALKKHLMEVEQIPEEKIAVATGDQRELDGINLFDPKCPIEYVITVEALKEGWDCSFAYAFCSVSRIQSAVDVEQLLGRVLRMPYAKRRKADALNRAYAFLSEPSFGEAARSLADKLVAMGFEEDEARDNIEPAQTSLDADTGLFGPRDKPKPTFKHTVTATPEVVAELKKREGVTVSRDRGGKVEIAVTGRVDGGLEKVIAETLPETERRGFSEAVAKYRVEVKDQLSPAEQGETFKVPRLMSEIQGALEFADTDVFMEFHDWSLLDHSSKLGEASSRSARRRAASRSTSTATASPISSPMRKSSWRSTSMLKAGRRRRWCCGSTGRCASRISTRRAAALAARSRRPSDHRTRMHISALMRCKFILARKVREKLAAIRQQERDGVYQRYLFAPEAKVDVSFDEAFAFKDGMYWDQRRYRGRWKPRRHFLGPDHVPAFDGAENGEEFQCAQAIDSLPGLKFWIRNVARHPNSFWLPTATDKFYPDFVAQLEDGRLLVVEYKGAQFADGPDTAEKRTIGQLWEKKAAEKGFSSLSRRLSRGRRCGRR
jgi:type III restriction enzyme